VTRPLSRTVRGAPEVCCPEARAEKKPQSLWPSGVGGRDAGRAGGDWAGRTPASGSHGVQARGGAAEWSQRAPPPALHWAHRQLTQRAGRGMGSSCSSLLKRNSAVSEPDAGDYVRCGRACARRRLVADPDLPPVPRARPPQLGRLLTRVRASAMAPTTSLGPSSLSLSRQPSGWGHLR